ncbi:hypothetical protein AYI70_g12123 [Smittium culicis]|uniref:Uncharacterized protein n=1 Tax=Smittium culicis TaxID=133412 RepID=A0A1R1WYR5_9FUNG|nr:hypothetical protein AYI70_g12123 [Smittium culicis]
MKISLTSTLLLVFSLKISANSKGKRSVVSKEYIGASGQINQNNIYFPGSLLFDNYNVSDEIFDGFEQNYGAKHEFDDENDDHKDSYYEDEYYDDEYMYLKYSDLPKDVELIQNSLTSSYTGK